jgi:aryl-alcohol dehydrogenase
VPRLAELHRAGRLPVDRLVTRFAFEDVAAAFAAARSGAAIKPVLTFA